jgi:hypothetical protein
LRPFSTRRSQPNPRADRRRKRWPGTGDANVLGNGVCRVAPTTLREAKPKAAAVPGATTADTDRGGRRAQKPSRSMPLTDSLAARSPSSATRRAGRPPTKINRGADRAVEKARGPVGRGDATTPAAGARLRRVWEPHERRRETQIPTRPCCSAGRTDAGAQSDGTAFSQPGVSQLLSPESPRAIDRGSAVATTTRKTARVDAPRPSRVGNTVERGGR